MKRDTYDVVIIGAGVGGLCCGALLCHAGIKTLVVDRSMYLGGRAGSRPFKEVLLDHAGHFLAWGYHGRVYQTIKEVGAEEVELEYARSYLTIYRDGEYIGLPVSVDEFIKSPLLPTIEDKTDIINILQEIDGLSIEQTHQLNKVPLSEWVSKKSNSEAVKFLFRAWGTWWNTFDDMSVLSAGEVVRALKDCMTFGFEHANSYPKYGLQSLWMSLAGALERDGGEIMLQSEVKKVIIEKGSVKGAILTTEKGKESDIRASFVVSNAPVQFTFDFIDQSHFPSDFVATVDKMQNRHTCSLGVLALLKKPIFPITSTTISFIDAPGLKGWPTEQMGAERRLVNFILAPTNLAPATAPKGTQQLLFGPVFPMEHSRDPERLKEYFDIMWKHLHAMFPEYEENVIWQKTGVNRLGDGLDRTVDMVPLRPGPEAPGVDGLYFCGDTAFQPEGAVGMDGAADSGRLCAQRIIEKINR
jgi:phytoene dehydrogenase-like protein